MVEELFSVDCVYRDEHFWRSAKLVTDRFKNEVVVSIHLVAVLEVDKERPLELSVYVPSVILSMCFMCTMSLMRWPFCCNPVMRILPLSAVTSNFVTCPCLHDAITTSKVRVISYDPLVVYSQHITARSSQRFYHRHGPFLRLNKVHSLHHQSSVFFQVQFLSFHPPLLP